MEKELAYNNCFFYAQSFCSAFLYLQTMVGGRAVYNELA